MDELEPDDEMNHGDSTEQDTFRDNVDYLLNESYEQEALEAGVATLVRPARIDKRARRRSPDLADGHDRRSPDWPAAASPPQTFGPTNVRGRETRAQQDTTWTRTTGILALCASLLFGLFSFLPSDRGPIAATRPIELIQPGQRVLVDAPDDALAADFARLTGSELAWDQSDGGWKLALDADPLREIEQATSQQITKADYRLVKLQARSVWEDGTVDEINVETLQPWQWLQHHEVHVGGRAPLPVDALEMGLPEELTGKVLDILPCPPLRGGSGRIVLTTVNHLNRDVIELTLCDAGGRTETLRPTGTHKFYSVTRGEWLSASQLENGERLDGVQGKITVAGMRRLPGTHRVYNMTVQGEHLYRVAQCGVLVHNTDCNDFVPDVVSEIGIAGSSRKIDVNAVELQNYGGPGGGHHIPAKKAFEGAPGYNVNEALAISNDMLAKLNVNHPLVTGTQSSLYRAFSRSGRELTWEVLENIETSALIRGGLSPVQARATVRRAIEALKERGVPGPTRIPWGG